MAKVKGGEGGEGRSEEEREVSEHTLRPCA